MQEGAIHPNLMVIHPPVLVVQMKPIEEAFQGRPSLQLLVGFKEAWVPDPHGSLPAALVMVRCRDRKRTKIQPAEDQSGRFTSSAVFESKFKLVQHRGIGWHANATNCGASECGQGVQLGIARVCDGVATRLNEAGELYWLGVPVSIRMDGWRGKHVPPLRALLA